MERESERDGREHSHGLELLVGHVRELVHAHVKGRLAGRILLVVRVDVRNVVLVDRLALGEGCLVREAAREARGRGRRGG